MIDLGSCVEVNDGCLTPKKHDNRQMLEVRTHVRLASLLY